MEDCSFGENHNSEMPLPVDAERNEEAGLDWDFLPVGNEELTGAVKPAEQRLSCSRNHGLAGWVRHAAQL